jgi:hypothetical protein
MSTFTLTKTETMEAIQWTGDNTAEVLEFIKGSRIGYFPGYYNNPIFGDGQRGIGIGGIITKRKLCERHGDTTETVFEFGMHHSQVSLKKQGYTWGDDI